MPIRTDGAARAEPNLFELCRVATEEDEVSEASVGKAIKDSVISRDSIWVTSKLWPNEYGEGKTLKAIDREARYFNMSYEDRKRWFMQWNPTD